MIGRMGSLAAAGLLALAAPALAAGPAKAAGAAPTLFEDRPLTLAVDPAARAEAWQFMFSVNGWLMGVDGDVGSGDRTAEVDAEFADVIDNLSIIVDLTFEAQKGKLVFIFETGWAKWDQDVEFPRIAREGDLTTNMVNLNPGLGYRLIDAPAGAGSVKLDALAGVRWTYLDMEFDVDGGDSRDRERDWFDPWVGARVTWDLSDQWSLSGKGTIGGFGVGSDLMWNAEGLIEYRFTRNVGLALGYRALSYDYDEDDFVFDVVMHGPVVGLTFRF